MEAIFFCDLRSVIRDHKYGIDTTIYGSHST